MASAHESNERGLEQENKLTSLYTKFTKFPHYSQMEEFLQNSFGRGYIEFWAEWSPETHIAAKQIFKDYGEGNKAHYSKISEDLRGEE